MCSKIKNYPYYDNQEIDIKKDWLLYNAYDFYETAYFLNNSTDIIYPNISALHSITITVNIAFACELFFKAILKKETKTIPKKHDLYSLFHSLDEHRQNTIFEIVNGDYQYDTHQSITRKIFEDSLNIVKNYFTEARYWFENIDFNNILNIDYKGTTFIKKICDAIIVILNSEIEEEYIHFQLLVSNKKLNYFKTLII